MGVACADSSQHIPPPSSGSNYVPAISHLCSVQNRGLDKGGWHSISTHDCNSSWLFFFYPFPAGFQPGSRCLKIILSYVAIWHPLLNFKGANAFDELATLMTGRRASQSVVSEDHCGIIFSLVVLSSANISPLQKSAWIRYRNYWAVLHENTHTDIWGLLALWACTSCILWTKKGSQSLPSSCLRISPLIWAIALSK